MWMSDVPHDAHRSQDHRQTEDLCHERLRGAPQKQDAQDDTNDGDDPHERAETERCGPGMAEVSVLPESHELERNRGQRAERPCEDRRDAEQEDEDGNSVLAPADAREAGKNANRQRQETTDRKSESSLRQGARRSVQGVLPKDRSSIYFSGASA